MSDPKRATLITVGATKGEKTKVNKTVRLTINLDESNESKYPELNYKELVIAEECKKRERVENGKTDGLNPFSDNDEDVERVARKFEQKYGGKSTYGRKGRSKHDDFADIGAGYDENDPFIDNTDGYDEMIPPECDTLYGGFYINCGALEFKNVDRSIDDDQTQRRNKRRISSSSSGDDSSDSSSESDSADDKEKPVLNGDVKSHRTEHRKKKNTNLDKKKAKKKRRTDSSAATSGKQTSDDNNHGDGESDSRTSQSDSLTSKPAPSSENAITSDSSRDVEAKEVKLPSQVAAVLEELEAAVSLLQAEKPAASSKELETRVEPYVLRLDRVLSTSGVSTGARSAAWARAARTLGLPTTQLLNALTPLNNHRDQNMPSTPAVNTSNPGSASVANPIANTTANTTVKVTNNKRTQPEETDLDVNMLTDEEREAKIVETLQRLKVIIEERRPGMMANYNAECERVQEERKKIQIAMFAGGAPCVEKRLPKRRFPWCPRTRALLATLVRLARTQEAAALLLAKRALPLFPSGFVRMPTLLRQADLSKEIKISEVKRQRLSSTSLPTPSQLNSAIQFSEPIQFPSSLTVTTMKPSPDKSETATEERDKKHSSVFGSIISSYSLAKDLLVEKQDVNNTDKKEDHYIPPNNIGSITITPVPKKDDKKMNNMASVTIMDKQKEGLIRVKSPAALNEMINKQEKVKALEHIHKREKDKHKVKDNPGLNHVKERIDTPLHIDTSCQPNTTQLTPPTPSPKTKEEVTKKQIENMRIAENNIPRPGLVPVSHSPTFAKPDKRPPEVKKKKDLLIVSDVDPLGDLQEPVSVDDSSSDVELVEDKVSESVPVPSDISAREKDRVDSDKKSDKLDDATKQEFDSVMKNLRDLEQHSQEAPKFNNSFGGVITSARRNKSSSDLGARAAMFADPRADKNKLTNFFEQNGWM